ncbi:hypothetical protein K504DRAFT_222962 [Pleomassaria siparia CBS 279.74]|uniref:Uncharacterized protein n=1 Tax=Pleomassaria siparia CBS 279.74 TaxID=1314801 RepID=A0A6G1KFW5_9PLEO|nr:hypothetical protein K504DRAFT_222962 [Pleomassaria siparia CBS 279.74]
MVALSTTSPFLSSRPGLVPKGITLSKTPTHSSSRKLHSTPPKRRENSLAPRSPLPASIAIRLSKKPPLPQKKKKKKKRHCMNRKKHTDTYICPLQNEKAKRSIYLSLYNACNTCASACASACTCPCLPVPARAWWPCRSARILVHPTCTAVEPRVG